MTTAIPGNAPLLEVRDLNVHFDVGQGKQLKAVDGVSVTLEAGRTLALVGESGSGKSTLGRSIVRLQAPTSGEIVLNGSEIGHLKGRALKPIYEHLQMVFQNPMTSLSPRQTVFQTLSEPLVLFKRGNAAARRQRAAELMDRVGMRRDLLDSLPQQLSGGQRQRVGIARALALNPQLIVADEPTASLDVSTQAQVINLMLELQRQLNLSYLFITHDLRIARHLSHRTVVLYLGRVVESGPTLELFDEPLHPYSATLVSARSRGKRIVVQGSVPSQIDRPVGCHFAGRCPILEAKCRTEYPPLREISPGRSVACHRPGELSLKKIRAEAS